MVIFNVSIKVRTAHSIRIILVRDGAVLSHARMPERDHTFLHDAPMVRSGAVVICVVSGKTSVADLLQGTVVFVVVR
jgi:hypothetical protein